MTALSALIAIAALLLGARWFALWIARISERARPPLARYDMFSERPEGDCFPVITNPECVDALHRSGDRP